MEPVSASQYAALGFSEEGDGLFDRGDFGGASVAYRAAANLWSNNPVFWYDLAITLREVGAFDDALEAIERAIQSDGDEPKFYHALGNIYRSLKDFPKAIQAFKKSMEIDPEFPAFNNLGLTYHNMNELVLARNTLMKGLDLFPHDTDLLHNIASVECAQGDYENAAIHDGLAAKLNPDLPNVWSILAGDLRELNRYPAAAEAVKRAIIHGGADSENYHDLGNIYMEMGEFLDAAVAFETALDLNPQSVGSMNQLALTYAELGDFPRAEQVWLKAISIATTEDERVELKRNLADAVRDNESRVLDNDGI